MASRAEILERLGGPVAPDLMDEIPDYEQWLRYFLYRFGTEDAYKLAGYAHQAMVTRPLP